MTEEQLWDPVNASKGNWTDDPESKMMVDSIPPNNVNMEDSDRISRFDILFQILLTHAISKKMGSWLLNFGLALFDWLFCF